MSAAVRWTVTPGGARAVSAEGDEVPSQGIGQRRGPSLEPGIASEGDADR